MTQLYWSQKNEAYYVYVHADIPYSESHNLQYETLQLLHLAVRNRNPIDNCLWQHVFFFG